MPAGKVRTDGQVPDLYVQASAARKQAQFLARELQAAKHKTMENWQLIRAAWDQTEQIRARRMAGRSDPDLLRYSAYARLQAQLASMPVSERPRGIIRAREGCAEDKPFDALRGASQRENVKLRDLAASIVARTAQAVPARRRAGPASTAAPSAGGGATPRAGSAGSGSGTQPRARPPGAARAKQVMAAAPPPHDGPPG